MLFYLATDLVAALGAFAVLVAIGEKGEANLTLEDVSGLGRTNPRAAMALAVFLLSLAGIPPTAGFFGKFLIFSAALDAGYAGRTCRRHPRARRHVDTRDG